VSVIHTIDLRYLGIPQALAAFVAFDPRRDLGPVLLETGPASTLRQLIDGLVRLNLTPRDIHHVLITHIHLDHAGAAGDLASTGMHIHVHEFGAKHLIDPSRLIDSATRIYGEQMDRLWGRIKPVPANQIHAVRNRDAIDVSGLRFRAIETPGHARHHHAFALEIDAEKVCFAGDAAGFNAPTVNKDFISVPTPPPEFDLEAWLATIDRLRAERFDALYLTHFGRVDDADAHLARLREIIPQHAEFVRQRAQADMPRDAILREYIEWNRRDAAKAGLSESDFARYVSRNLLTMNVDGLLRYWRKRAEAAGAGPTAEITAGDA
jgi:glyoxylase-like metal-dependent hydrolase (beta-lactamase superfamily II)